MPSLVIAAALLLAASPAAAQATLNIKNSAVASVDVTSVVRHADGDLSGLSAGDATRIYTIGVNDILRIELKDVPGVVRTVRVQPDGTIAYPMVDNGLTLTGKTATEAEALISESVRTLSKAGVRIRIAEYLSHTVTVWGLVGDPGEQQIQRDAVPFFVVRAMTSVDPRANAVQIIRAASSKTERYMIGESKLDSLLIYPGDSVEFGQGPISGNSN
jgi:protein involved in polysaccharide export with SLBB domain